MSPSFDVMATPDAPPGAETIAALADRALAVIPPELRRHVAGVGIVVEEEADEESLAALGIESAWDLTGLYRGVPFGQKEGGGVPHAPDLITLYRLPILLEWIETGESLSRLVRNVLIHEIAHHFGFSDADIARLEAE